MKTMKENVSLDEKIEQISNELLFHPHPLIEKLFLDHATVCTLLGIHPRTLCHYKEKGLIQSRIIGKSAAYKLFDVETLAKFISLRRFSRDVESK